jgi:geranylgeranyl diphosphate synthase, type I
MNPSTDLDLTTATPWIPRPAPARMVSLPTYAPTGLPRHLGAVDDLLAGVLDDLTRVWSTEVDDSGELDVLGERDLPVLMRELLQGGGKRIRPAMTYLGWLSTRGDGTGRGHVVTAGAALELLHVFALIHDDVMDQSASRRGRPSVHTQAAQLHVDSSAGGDAGRFGESIAVLVGDLAHAEADHLASDLPADMRSIWRTLVVELVCGQRRDLTGSAAGRRDLGHARQVARMKSGSYTVERPLQLGAAAARANDTVRTRLARYGREVGEAFALRDDLLGVWGDPALTGKPAGDDLLSGKPTVILSIASERLTGSSRKLLDRTGSLDRGLEPDDVALLLDELERAGVVESVEAMIAGHLDRALAALDDPQLDPEGVAGLTQLAHQVAWRDR